MSLPSKRDYLQRIHGRYQRADKPHKTRIPDEFCAVCGYHRKATLRLLNRPLLRPAKRLYDPAVVLPPLKALWLGSDQLCSKLLKVALPEWLEFYEQNHAPLAAPVRQQLPAISPAQVDRLLQPVRLQVRLIHLAGQCPWCKTHFDNTT
jgi:hypothetical protein